MNRWTAVIPVLVLCNFVLMSCSGSGNPVAQSPDPSAHAGSNPQTAPPILTQDANPAGNVGGHQLWGYWLIGIDPQTNQYEIFPARLVEDHLNVLKWLEQGPCTNCLKITKFIDSDHGTKLVTVSIKHPFSTKNLTGFDVRGIAMFNGSHLFPTSGLNAPDRNMGDGELINADGYTTLYNSTTVGSGPGGLQGYLKGKFATATIPSAKLNGFKRFDSQNPANTRSAFYAGTTLSRDYDIDMPGSPFVLGYAVDASWAPPIIKPVTDPMIDFPVQANCYEPYKITVIVEDGVLNEQAGTLKVGIAIEDHQGDGSHAKPLLECPELFDSALEPSSGGPDWYITYVSNTKHASPGLYKVLVSVEDNQNSGSDPWIDLTAYQIFTVQVYKDTGWARTWGSSNWDRGNAVATDNLGNTYVAGIYQGDVDFDPGLGIAVFGSAYDSIDAFVSKFDSMGNFLWVRTWGGPGVDTANGVAISDHIVVVGEFEDTVNFKTYGTDQKTSNGGSDAYAIELLPDYGEYVRTQTWGGTDDDTASAVAYSSMNDRILVTGSFKNSLQFPGGQSAISKGQSDIYMVDVTHLHNLLGTWGGTGDDMGLGITFQSSSIIAYVTGAFQDQVAFNPGGMGGTLDSAGGYDTFLASYDTSLDGAPVNQWVTCWGDTGYDVGNSVCANGTDIYVTGSFQGNVDFDPSGSTDSRTAGGDADAYVCHYGSGGAYFGVTTWGGDDPLAMDAGQNIAVDQNGNVYAAGSFFGEAFGTSSNGSFDGVVASYDPDLNLQWKAIFGGPGSDGCNGVATDVWDRIFVTGGYQDTVDFDPSGNVEDHTFNGGLADCFLLKLHTDGLW